MARDGLTPKQEKFAQLFVQLGNASEAYRQAYSCAKSKPEVIHVKASELLASGKVAVRVAELRAETASKMGITRERVLGEVAKIAFFDIRSIFNSDGTLKHVKDLDDTAAAAIAGIETIQVGEDGNLLLTKKFKMSDKNVALEKLMKHLGLYELDNKQKTDPVADLLAALKGNVTGVAQTGVGLNVPEDED